MRARVCLTRSCLSPTLHPRDSSAFLKEKTLNPKIATLRFQHLRGDGGVYRSGRADSIPLICVSLCICWSLFTQCAFKVCVSCTWFTYVYRQWYRYIIQYVFVCSFNRGPGSEGGGVQRHRWCAGPHQQLHKVPRYDGIWMSVWERLRVCVWVCEHRLKDIKDPILVHLMFFFVCSRTIGLFLLFTTSTLLPSRSPEPSLPLSAHKPPETRGQNWHHLPV